ncbi:MAG: OmpA family protein [Kiloniellales bacterium]|nr:OmpA family protein [Kiloniellales bacterium]
MRNLGKLSLVCLGTLALGGCGTRLQTAEQVQPVGSDFQAGLYEGYVELARSEFAEGDYFDSDSFAERAIASARGEAVLPEALEARRLPTQEAGRLAEARARLVAALDGGAREGDPAAAAEGQVLFDCWMQEQEESLESEDAAACREGFYQVLATLEAGVAAAQAAAVETDPTVMVKELDEPVASAAAPQGGEAPGSPGTFIVFFDIDTAALSPEAEEILAEVVRAANESSSAKIRAAGHADLAGPSDYNESLAKRRADAVVQYLVQSGVDKLRLESEGFGERKPLIPTDEDEFQLQNRRVEIQFLTGPGAD